MKIGYLAAFVSLCACDVLEPKEVKSEAPIVAVEASPKEPTPPKLEAPENATLFERFNGNNIALKLSQNAIVNKQERLVTVSGDFSAASPGGRTTGAVFRISADREAEVSGKTVEVHIVARGGPLAAAYSTADVGNSGWKQFKGSQAWTVSSFRYEVPVMDAGKGDFIGIIPTDPVAEIQVKAVRVFVEN